MYSQFESMVSNSSEQKLQDYDQILNVLVRISPPKQKLRDYKLFSNVYSQFESMVSKSSDQKLQDYDQI